MRPLVSILIPCHNAAPWIGGAIDSAIGQSWPEVEVIVVDDGSIDGSLEAAKRHADDRVRVISQENRGASAARNRAFCEARGEFIQFLDADDLLSPEKIARQLARLREAVPGSVASCAWGRFKDDPTRAEFVDEAVFRDFEPIDYLVLCGEGPHMMHPSAWLTPRAVADRAGPWDESLSLNDDGEYFCRVLLSSAGVAYAAGARSYYRSGLPGSLSQRRDERSGRSQFRSVESIVKHLLATEDSLRTRRAAACYYQRFIYDFFPFPRDLMRLAESRVRALGGCTIAPPMGARTRLLARVIGWRNVWRLKHCLRR
jgi:glycosyltransferase involved in cell wall biosynthesis